MSITALEIQEIRFDEVKRGYDPNEVDEFLERVAADVDTLNRALSEAAVRIKSAERRAEEAEQKLAQLAEAPSVPPAEPAVDVPSFEPVEEEPSEPTISGDDIAKAFIAAQRSADALQEEARREAEKLYKDAEARGRDIVRDALSEKQKALDELARLRESCEKFRTEYISLLKYFESDAQKRLIVFDDVLQSQTAKDSMTAPVNYPAPTEAAYQVAESPDGAARAAVQDPFAAPAYQMSFDEEDDLDIEEID